MNLEITHKKLPDSENFMEIVNRVNNTYQQFLRTYSGFIRDELQGYNFLHSPPQNKLDMIDNIA